ncbi:MAG: hypothetical protein K8R60_17900 [Burkholderiales bacterium]|nr:hypothetical protein [Burkholderiales bacterium]
MLTNTPLDLTPFGPLVSLLGIGYWLLAVGAAAWAFRLPRGLPARVGLATLVLAAFLAPVVWKSRTRAADPSASPEARQAAMVYFAERCKTAGERISQTVDDVEGIAWTRWRDKYSSRDNFADQWKLNDPYGRDCGMEECIAALLRVTSGAEQMPDEAMRHAVGYRFVETVDPRDGRSYRYRASIRVTHQRTRDQLEQFKKNTGGQDPGLDVLGFAIDREPLAKPTARYGVTWEDISTHEDREHWIAGGALKVVDLQTNEVIAERTGFLMDPGQGSTSGSRSPWAWAKSYGPRCPQIDVSTKDFVTRVLKARRGQ